MFFGGVVAPALISLVVAQLFVQTGSTVDPWVNWQLRLLTNALAVFTLVPPIVLTCRKAPPPATRPGGAARRRGGRVARRPGDQRRAAVRAAGGGQRAFATPPLRAVPVPALGGHALRRRRHLPRGADAGGGLDLECRQRPRPVRRPGPDRERHLARPLPQRHLRAAVDARGAARGPRERGRGTPPGGRRCTAPCSPRCTTRSRSSTARAWSSRSTNPGRAAGRPDPGVRLPRRSAGRGARALRTRARCASWPASRRSCAATARASRWSCAGRPASNGWFEMSAKGLQAARRRRGDHPHRHHRPQAGRGLDARQQRQELAHLTRVAMLGELSGALAHELNQPLTAILSNAQAAQRLLAQRAGGPRRGARDPRRHRGRRPPRGRGHPTPARDAQEGRAEDGPRSTSTSWCGRCSVSRTAT